MSWLVVVSDGSVLNLGSIVMMVQDAESRASGEGHWTVVMSNGDKLTINGLAHDMIVAAIREYQTNELRPKGQEKAGRTEGEER